MKDFSYGVVPIYKKTTGLDEPYFLLIEQHGEFWSFPKGHKEEGESDFEAARRELFEEVGISDGNLIESEKFIECYSFQQKGITLDKTVSFYPFITDSLEVRIDKNEVTDSRWVRYEEAIKMLTFKETKAVLDQADNWLKTLKS